MIGFGCPSCRLALAVEERDAGTIGWCPNCHTPYVAPRSGEIIATANRRAIHGSSKPIPITVSMPMLVLFFAIAGLILAGSLYGIIHSSRSHYTPEQRTQRTPSSPAPTPKSATDQGPTRPEADVDGQPWTFDPPPRLNAEKPLTGRYLEKIPVEVSVMPENVAGTIYFAEHNGTFHAVNPQTLQVERHKIGHSFYGFAREGRTLLASFDFPPKFQPIAEFDQPIDTSDSEFVQVLGRKIGKYELPNDWIVTSPVVYFRGRYYCCADGSVKVLDRGAFSSYSSKLKNLRLWRIALLPTGPAGYDNAGVFELDEHLCPIKRVINLRNYPDSVVEHTLSFLASDGHTLCFLTTYEKVTRMQIWSLDGRTKLREIQLTYNSAWAQNHSSNIEPNRLLAAGGGYLFSGHELTWLSADERRPMQYTAPLPDFRQKFIFQSQEQREWLEKQDLNKNFTPAVLAGNRIFAGHADGGMYVFDEGTFAGTAGPRDVAAGNQ